MESHGADSAPWDSIPGYPAAGVGTGSGMTRKSRLTTTVLALTASAGLLVGCGDNSNIGRGETNCDSHDATDASNEHDASCEETGNSGNSNP